MEGTVRTPRDLRGGRPRDLIELHGASVGDGVLGSCEGLSSLEKGMRVVGDHWEK